MALVTTIGMRFLQVCTVLSNSKSSSQKKKPKKSKVFPATEGGSDYYDDDDAQSIFQSSVQDKGAWNFRSLSYYGLVRGTSRLHPRFNLLGFDNFFNVICYKLFPFPV